MTQKDVPLKSRDTPPGPRRPGNIPARRPRASLSPRPSSRPPSEKTPQKSLHRILSLSRALSRRSRRPRRQLPRFSPRPSASRLPTWTLLTRHRARSRRSSTPAHRARPTVTPAFAVAIPRPRRGLRARAYASPSASPRSLARVAVGRRHPRVHFFQPLARFIALYRTLSHNLPPRACTFCTRFFLERVSGEIHESRLVSTHARGCGHLRVWGEREGLPARPSNCLRTPVCRAARGGGRVVVGRRFVWDAREGWTREARRRRAWDGGGRYIVSREVRVKCVCARARG